MSKISGGAHMCACAGIRFVSLHFKASYRENLWSVVSLVLQDETQEDKTQPLLMYSLTPYRDQK